MQTRHLLPVLVLCALALVACGPVASPTASPSPQAGPGGGTSELENTEWVLTSVGGASPLPGTTINISFANGQVTGFGGCNTYSATYTAAGGTIDISQVVSTRMACPEPVGRQEQENAYFESLDRTDGYTITGDKLAFNMGGLREVLVFTRK